MGSGVVVEVELEELWVGSGVGSVFDVELSATELLEAVELEVDVLDALELDVDEELLDVDEDELLELVEELLELDEELLDADEDVLEVLSSGLSSPQPVRSAAARIAEKIVVFFIIYLLKANIFLL